MSDWLKVDDYCKLTGFGEDRVMSMIHDGYLSSKNESGIIYIEATSGTNAVVKKSDASIVEDEQESAYLGSSASFVEKTIGTILNLHEKVLESKDETLSALKSENQFLKDALFSMQDVYEEDKKTINTLSEQLKIAQEELSFMKRKYKLMWGKISTSEEQK